jgi:beta-glucosidase
MVAPRRVLRGRAGIVVCALIATLPAGTRAQAPPYRDASLPVEARVQDLLDRMTLEEKFWQLYMVPGSLEDPSHDWSTGVFGLQVRATAAGDSAGARDHAIRINRIQRYLVEDTRLGIPMIPFEEALHGLVLEDATVFPQAIALAATFDTALVGRVSRAIARETRHRGVRQVLSPVVNIATDVRWGRVEETYGEDPHLSTVMGLAFVRAFERAGVIATPKHFVANVGEGGRDSYPIEVSERLLMETHYPPFRAAVQQARARSIMTAYNSVDGAPATQNRRLLTETLKRDWGFAGFVISDAAATGGAVVLHHTEPNTAAAAQHALESGLDVIFQSSWEQHRPYLQAFRSGRIADAVIDSAVTRVLRAKFALGLFEDPYVDPDSAAFWNGHADHRALAREAARASLVLLKNDNGALPLNRSALRSVAVIGLDAEEARLGGYSGPGERRISILDGIRELVGSSVAVRYAPGPGRTSSDDVVVPSSALHHVDGDSTVSGLRGEYFEGIRLEGEPRFMRTDRDIDFRWTLNSPGRGIPFDWYSVRWTGTLTAPAGGMRRLGVEGNDGYRLWLDGGLIIDNWQKVSFGRRLSDVTLVPGRSYDLRLEFFESTGIARVKLVWDAGADVEWRARIDSAARVARTGDVAIVVAGIDEGEFQDRAFLGLPGHQEALVDAVADTGTPVVVVLVGGSAITMSSRLDRAGAVLHAWYPGEEGGRAVADVLFGDADPGGRLPITFPVAEGQLPLTYRHKPTGRGDDYRDLTGMALFPFGHGLSYTQFEYSGLVIEPAQIPPVGSAIVRARVRNAGTRAGEEVVQLYVRDEIGSVARPVMELKGFRRVRLAPGEEAEVVFELGRDALEMLDEQMRRVVEPGRFRIMVGRSSEDVRLRGFLDVRSD